MLIPTDRPEKADIRRGLQPRSMSAHVCGYAVRWRFEEMTPVLNPAK